MKIYLGIPTHDGRINHQLVNAIVSAGKSVQRLTIESGSALTTNFNNLYCKALNARKEGFTHFLMLHEDVVPHDHLWAEKMAGIMENFRCQMLSAVVRLKSNDGRTSTAVTEPDSSLPLGFRARKLSLKEIREKYESTFTEEGILLNTGCMMLDLRWDKADKLCFKFRDEIRFKDGVHYPMSLAEDYDMTLQVTERGGFAYATRDLHVSHMQGNVAFSNQEMV